MRARSRTPASYAASITSMTAWSVTGGVATCWPTKPELLHRLARLGSSAPSGFPAAAGAASLAKMNLSRYTQRHSNKRPAHLGL